MSILFRICAAIGLIFLLFGGGSFLLGFIGVIGAAGAGLFVLALPVLGLIFVIIFLVWLVYKFAATLFSKDKKKES